MRAQSAIEFLSTYGFLFLIVGVTLTMISFLSTSASSEVPTQCSSFGGPACNFVSFFSNSSAGYSLVTLSITNSESIPINITSFAVTAQNTTFAGICAPQFLYPGQQATCMANLTQTPSPGYNLQATYVLNAKYCNLGLSSVSKGYCAIPGLANYETVSYGGSFSTTVVQQRTAIFSVAAAVGPKNFAGSQPGLSGLQPFTSNSGPLVPANYTIAENGAWSDAVSGNSFQYAFSTTNSLGISIYGRNAVSFPASVASALGANGVACSNSFNSTLSLASTVVYVGANTVTANVVVVADNSMEVFVKSAASSGNWINIFKGSAWGLGAATQFGPNAVALNKGLYYVEVLWANNCGPGVQEFSFGWP